MQSSHIENFQDNSVHQNMTKGATTDIISNELQDGNKKYKEEAMRYNTTRHTAYLKDKPRNTLETLAQ